MEEFNWGFSRREKIGLFGIASIISILLLINLVFSKSNQSNQFEDNQDFQIAIKEANEERAQIAKLKEEKKKAYKNKFTKKEPNKKFENKYQPKNKKSETALEYNNKKQDPNSNNEKSAKLNPKVELSFFDPNSASLENLIKLGIPKRTAHTIINFRDKGGKFLKAEDLKIVYGISESIYQSLKDYILIPKKSTVPKVDIPKPKRAIKIAINQATAEEWMKLRGIGPTLSARIVKYRDKLGGFAKVDQLKEVYNLPDSTFNAINTQLELNQTIAKRLIQELSIKELISHPYISKTMAGKIISKLDRNEKFRNWQEFQNFLKITPKQLENIQYYFDIL